MKNGAVITPHPKLLLTAVKIKTMNKILLISNITLHIIYKTIDRKNSVDHTCISSPAKIINISMHQAAREKNNQRNIINKLDRHQHDAITIVKTLKKLYKAHVNQRQQRSWKRCLYLNKSSRFLAVTK